MRYGTAVDFRAYHTERGTLSDIYSDKTVNAALLLASEWIDARFRTLFDGEKIGMREQVREWPRSGAVDFHGDAVATDRVPLEVEHATYEAALVQLVTPGSLSVNYTPSQYSQVSIDGALSVTYMPYSSADQLQTQYKKIEEILSALTTRRYRANSHYSGPAVRA